MRLKMIFATLTLSSFGLASGPELWVGSYFGDTIQRYDLATGNAIGTVGTGKLDGTLGMSLGSDGAVYVCSELTGSVEKFDQSGTWESRFLNASSPTGIAFDKLGNAFVSQFDLDSVAKFSPSGTNLGTFVSPGSGGLDGPDLGITFGPDGEFYVPSFYGGDVMKYDHATGAFLGKFIPAGSGGLTQPRQMLWRDGKVYVSSDNGSKVLRYDGTTGAFIDTFVAAGSGGLNGATGLAFSGDSLYVTSWKNNRVLRYDASTGAFQGAFVVSGLNGPVSLLVVPEPNTLLVSVLGCGWFAKRRLMKRR